MNCCSYRAWSIHWLSLVASAERYEELTPVAKLPICCLIDLDMPFIILQLLHCVNGACCFAWESLVGFPTRCSVALRLTPSYNNAVVPLPLILLSFQEEVAEAVSHLSLSSAAVPNSPPSPPAISSEERKERWEQGQADYMGADSFDNIKKKLDTYLQ